MQCPNCQVINPEGAKFCTGCGAPLSVPEQPKPMLQPQDNPLPPIGQPAVTPMQPPQNVQPPFGQPNNTVPQQPNTMPTSAKTPPKKNGKTLIIALIIVAILIIGGLLFTKFFPGEDVQINASTADETTVTADTTTLSPGQETTIAADPTQTTEVMNGTTERDFSILYGEWVDQGGRYDLYVKPDGTFYLAMPEGIFTGQIDRQGTDYSLKADDNPAQLKDAAISLTKDGGAQALKLQTADGAVTLDFLHIPEKDELFDWILLDYADNYLDYYDHYDECTVDQDLLSEKVIMIANYPLRDVKYLALEMVDVQQDGTLVCKTEELYTQPVLLNRRPLLINVANIGDLPTRGVSFVDLDGVTHYFEISYSGYDGSLYYSEFEPYK